jgi:hypothetical protein
MTLSVDPARLLLDIALAVVGAALAVWLIPRRVRRVRQYGGTPAAEAVTVAAILALAVALQADLMPLAASLVLLLVAVLVAFRPEHVVRLTGGPRVEWRALAEGTALQRLVATRSDRRSASHYPAVRERLARLDTASAPSTARYIELLHATLFSDPHGPGMSERLAALAVEESNLRRAVGPRPTFEGGLVEVDEAPVPERPAEPPDDDNQPTHG